MRGMKKVVSSNDVDSAFGSAESTTKDGSSEEVYLLLIFLITQFFLIAQYSAV